MGRGIDTLKVSLPGGGMDRVTLLVLHGADPSELKRSAAWAVSCSRAVEVVAVDGGYDACRAAGIAVQRYVGDGDSVARPPRDVEIHSYPADKDYSDLAGALRTVRRNGADALFVAGLLGGRIDHEFANLQELARATRCHRAILSCGERGAWILTRHGLRLGTRAGRRFSLFAATSRTCVTLRGARWTLRAKRLLRPSHGLSNVTTGPLDLQVHDGMAHLLFPATRV